MVMLINSTKILSLENFNEVSKRIIRWLVFALFLHWNVLSSMKCLTAILSQSLMAKIHLFTSEVQSFRLQNAFIYCSLNTYKYAVDGF